MIEPVTAIALTAFGAALMLVGIIAGCLLDMRYLNRKFMKPVSKQTQQLPAVKS
jgi:Flp pilus assembly protein TadB